MVAAVRPDRPQLSQDGSQAAPVVQVAKQSQGGFLVLDRVGKVAGHRLCAPQFDQSAGLAEFIVQISEQLQGGLKVLGRADEVADQPPHDP